jgi:hypothetical protein
LKGFSNSWWDAEGSIREAADAQADMIRTLIEASRQLDRETALTALETRQKQAISDLEASRDEEIADLENARDAYERTSNTRISGLEKELELLERKHDAEQANADLAEKQKALEEARTALANIQNDRNVRVWNGTGWEYVADPAKVKEAQDKLLQAEQDYSDKKDDLQYNADRQALQDRIDNERETQRAELDSYNQRLQDERDYWEDRLKDEKDNQDAEKTQ